METSPASVCVLAKGGQLGAVSVKQTRVNFRFQSPFNVVSGERWRSAVH
jgi:hypothetical protein